MRKKLLAMLLVLVMLGVSLLSGCGKDAKETGGAVESSSSDSGSVKEVTDNSSDTSESDTQAVGESDSESDTQTESISEVSGETEKIQTYFVRARGEFSLGKTVEENIKGMVEAVMGIIDNEVWNLMITGDRTAVSTKSEIRDAILSSNAAADCVKIDYDAEQFGGLVSMISTASDLMAEPARGHYKVNSSFGYGCSSVEVMDANIDEFYYFEGTDAVIGMYVAYTMECKLKVQAFDRLGVRDVDGSRTGYLAVALVNDPERPEYWKISGIYSLTPHPYYNDIDAPEELVETCFDFENKLVSETVLQAQQEIAESADEDFQAAMNAYSQQFSDSWGEMIGLSGSPIPFYVVEEHYDDRDWINIYHYEGGQIVKVAENGYLGESTTDVYYNDNLIHMSSIYESKNFEYKDGTLSEIDDETSAEISERNGWTPDRHITIEPYADALADYTLSR